MHVCRSILLFSASFVFIACGQAPQTNPPASGGNSVPAQPSAMPSPDVMAEGRKIYMANCAACHKETGKGGKITIEGKSIDPEDLTAAKIKAFPDDKLYGYIFNGIEDEGMPAFKNKLSEAEIREVVRYLRIEIQKMPAGSPGNP